MLVFGFAGANLQMPQNYCKLSRIIFLPKM
jgi:hypothetical protein